MQKICEWDQVPFESQRASAKYCSDKCRKAAARGAVLPIDGKMPPSSKALDEAMEKADLKLADVVELEGVYDKDGKPKIVPYDREANLAAFRKMGLQEITWITTGIPEFDALTMIPRGRITQIQGPLSVGKTTLCLNMIQGLKGQKVLYIDSEAALNPELLADLQLDAKFFDLYNESAFIEDIYEVVLHAVEKKKYDMIILDSLASTTFRTEAANQAADANIGQKARIVGKLMRIVPMELKRTNTALVIINQERDLIGSPYPQIYTPGGRGVEFAASLMIRLKTTKGARFPSSGPPFKGHTVSVEIIKSKVNTPWRKTEFKLYYKGTYEQSHESTAPDVTTNFHIDSKTSEKNT